MNPPRTICVVEDDPAIRRGLADSLRFAGYRVLECADGAEARRALRRAELDLVLLDVMLPGMNGLDYLDELRQHRPRLPVIMVTARGAESDRVRGLRSGADDYVVKPFSSTELLARVDAVLRRSGERPVEVRFVVEGGVRVDLARREVLGPDGAPRASLTERETELLEHLARHPGRPVERAELLRWVWGLDPAGLDTRTVDMTVVRLREKLGDVGTRVVSTVRGKGYMLGATTEAHA